MASFEPKKQDRKASSLPDATTAHRPGGLDREERKSMTGGGRMVGKSNPVWCAILVDLILLAVLVGLIVGGVFAYRGIREMYAPTWESREVVFCVEMTGLATDSIRYGQNNRPVMVGQPLWSSDRTDADFLGTVTEVRVERVTHENENETLNLYLTVEATALYREGKGYRMGATMLLAGMKGEFMAQELVSEGTVISMHEKIAESTPEP